jgi:hypothetical protein
MKVKAENYSYRYTYSTKSYVFMKKRIADCIQNGGGHLIIVI